MTAGSAGASAESCGPRPALAVAISLAIIAAGAVVLWLMGRTPICTCGTIKLWHGNVLSAENSQHIADWYSFTHVSHGLIFYAVLQAANKALSAKFSFLTLLAIAIGIETAWEIAENSSFVIDRYRAATISLNYYGDSILNSIADIFAMILGFWLARKLPAYLSIVLFLAMEAMLAYVIRDNLLLNIIMLLYPLDSIRVWQQAG